MKKLICLLVLFLLAEIALSKNISDGIAMVIAYDEYGEELDLGAGVITGRRGKQLYVATAYHVIEHAAKVKLKFLHNIQREYDAEIYENFDKEQDLGLLVAEVPFEDGIPYYTFKKAWLPKVKEGQAITCIGHPSGSNGWLVNKRNSIINPASALYTISITPEGVLPGYSGGVLLNRGNNQLIGMILNRDGAESNVLRIDAIIQKLQEWHAPTDYIQPFKPSISPVSYALIGLAAGSFAYGLDQNNAGNNIYDFPYAAIQQENAPNYNGTSRPSILEQATEHQKNRNLAYIVSGGLLASAVIYHLIRLKKYEQKTYYRSWSAQAFGGPGLNGNPNIGVIIKF